jgi:hypothetical protein
VLEQEPESSGEKLPQHYLQEQNVADTEKNKLPLSSSTVTMEVHHHPDIHHRRKKFKEYFLEFLMIFLAVTLGFFAESLRENISDGQKEHEYMQSLLNNLRTDSLKMEYTIKDNIRKSAGLDSMLKLCLTDLSKPVNRISLYKNSYYPGFYSLFKSNDATMQQLKNSGGLRIIRKDHVADSIAQYDYEVKIIYAAENLYNIATDAAVVTAREILDYSIADDSVYYKNNNFTGKLPPLVADDPKKIKFLYNKIDYEKRATNNYVRNLQLRLPFLKSLLQFLKMEYNLD